MASKEVSIMKNLRKRRNELGMTLEELGNFANVQKSAVSKYELGHAQPSQDVLLKFSEILKTTTDYLLGKTDNPNPPDKAADEVWELREELHKRPELKILFETSRKAKKEDIEFADKFLKGVTKENDYD